MRGIGAAGTVFAALHAAPVAACTTLVAFAQSGQLPTVGTEAVTCTTSQVLGAGTSEDCFWTFPLRAAEARTEFRALAAQLRACSPAGVDRHPSDVNHPDSFDQVTGVIGGTAISVSMKDKGALGQTLLVLRRTLPE